MSQTVTVTAYTPQERMPPPRKPILVYTPEGDVEIAMFLPARPGSLAGFFLDDEGEEIDGTVALWAELPKFSPQ